MNVILSVDEVHAVLTRVSSQVIDRAGLSAKGVDALKAWRTEHGLGSDELNALARTFNERLGNDIDARTTRMLRQRGGRKERASAGWVS